MTNLPLFIVGSPRSGTTLIRLIFNSHSKIAVPDETNIFGWLFERPFYKNWLPRLSKENFLLSKSLGEDIVRKFDRQPAVERVDNKKIVDFLFSRYAAKCGKLYWGEKTPTHSRYVAQIRATYPNSTIIYMVRDPRAVVASSKRYFHKKRGAVDFWISPDISNAIKMWRESIAEAIRNKEDLYFVYYEELVREPEETLTRLTETLGVPYEKKMLDYYKNSPNVTSAANEDKVLEWHRETTRQVNAENIDKWKNELTKEEIIKVEQELSEYFNYFKYDKIY
ncbi:sulfotransferase [Candidatus Pacearchaeota archaeon]|nr:sulfotransferase [Candidatus Pacearchaeota archaeon]